MLQIDENGGNLIKMSLAISLVYIEDREADRPTPRGYSP